MDRANPRGLWPVGGGGMVARERIVAVGRYDSAPLRRAVRRAKENDRLIDLTFGYACRWVLFLDTGQMVISADLSWLSAEPDVKAPGVTSIRGLT